MAWEEILAGIGAGLQGGSDYYVNHLLRQDKLKKEDEERKIAREGIASKQEIADLRNLSAQQIQQLKNDSTADKAKSDAMWHQIVATITANSRNYAADRGVDVANIRATAWKDVAGGQNLSREKIADMDAASDLAVQLARNKGTAAVASIMAAAGIAEINRKAEVGQDGKEYEVITHEITDPETGNKFRRQVRVPSGTYSGGTGWESEGAGAGAGEPMPTTPSSDKWGSEFGPSPGGIPTLPGRDINLSAPRGTPPPAGGLQIPQQKPVGQLPPPPGFNAGAMPQIGGVPPPGQRSLATAPPAAPPTGPVVPQSMKPPAAGQPMSPPAASSPQTTQAQSRIQALMQQIQQEKDPQRRARLVAELRRLRGSVQ